MSRFLKSLRADLVLDHKVAEDWSNPWSCRGRWWSGERERAGGPNPKTRSHTLAVLLVPQAGSATLKTHELAVAPHIQGEECTAADGRSWSRPTYPASWVSPGQKLTFTPHAQSDQKLRGLGDDFLNAETGIKDAVDCVNHRSR